MYKIVSRLLIYGDMPKDTILMELADIARRMDDGSQKKEELIIRAFTQMKHLLQVATDYGFDKNLWHNYLTFLLITSENPFSITCEKVGANEGSVNYFAKGDFRAFKQLFDYDFGRLEEFLGVDCFSRISNYRAIGKKELMYNKNVSEKVQALSLQLEEAADEEEFFDCVTGFYRDYGVGMFGLNKAFRISSGADGQVVFHAINNMDAVMLEDLVGYEIQKKKLIDNTLAFVQGRKANNVLLFGDSGTGKSTSVKAIVNAFYPQGLRMIEIYKHQFHQLSNIIGQIKNRNYKFIIYMDDLSFEEFEIEYKYLKAVIEGGLEVKPDNVLIYATSNRRHLIRETWSDRSDMSSDELHRSDTMQEKLSLVARFGVSINFSRPSKKEFEEIVLGLAAQNADLTLSKEEILQKANAWSVRNGGYSGRVAEQFITHLKGQNSYV